MDNLEAAAVAREMQDCVHLHTINTYTCVHTNVLEQRDHLTHLRRVAQVGGTTRGVSRGMGQDICVRASQREASVATVGLAKGTA